MASNANSEAITAHLPHLTIVDRFVELPMVNPALDYARARYAQLKGASALINSTLDRAENTVKYVVDTAVVPVVKQFEQPIQYADDKAVRSFDFVQEKVGSLKKSSGDFTENTQKFIGQTKDRLLEVKTHTQERIQEVKKQTLTSVQSKAHSLLTLPSNFLPLVDQILSAGENVLDYLLPEEKVKGANGGQAVAPSADNGSTAPANGKPSQDDAAKDPKALLRFVIYRVRLFTEKVQRRVVDYSRERWIPALFSRAIIIKDNVSQLVSNGNKLLLSNGHAQPNSQPTQQAQPEAEQVATTTTPATTNASPKTSTPNQSPTKNNSHKKSPNATPTSTKSTQSNSNSPVGNNSNGDIAQAAQEHVEAN